MDVVVGEVVGPDRDLLGPGVEVYLDPDLPALKVDERAVLSDTAVAADLHAVDGDVEPRQIGRASCRERV